MNNILEMQSVFDKVALHLLNQGMKSVNDAGEYMYRGDNSRSCAIGCLVSDDVYHVSLEGKTSRHIDVINSLYQSNPLILKIPNILDLIDGLQSVHDNVDASNWVYHLSKVAKNYGLSADAIIKRAKISEGLAKLGQAMKQQHQDELNTNS